MNQRNVKVGLIGIPGIEEKRLNAAFNYSHSRNKSYDLDSLDEQPSILMVNADEPASLIKWRVYRDNLEKQGHTEPPSVLVSQNREFNTSHYQVKRPLIATRVISVLDQVTDAELEGIEEIAIIESIDSTAANEAVNQNQPSQRSLQTKTDDEKTTTRQQPKALVVDDSLPVRIQMDKALNQYAIVDFAVTGEEAYSFIEKNEYDIIFLDVVLPGVDGYEVCKTIKEGKAKDTPVIMLTGNSSPADRIKGKLAGCDTYLIKPVNQTVFQEVVNQYLNTRQMPALSG